MIGNKSHDAKRRLLADLRGGFVEDVAVSPGSANIVHIEVPAGAPALARVPMNEVLGA
jgi:hypothetical protein